MVDSTPRRLSEHEFERAVEDALALIPAPLLAQLRNVAIFVEPEPPAGEDPSLLGLYEGFPLTDGDEPWFGALPDRILIFQGPLERLCETREELLDEIAVTVVHEVAHHFGVDDERLHELGYA